MKLKDLVNLKVNNSECVILEVKPDSFMGLIQLGCFTGTEKLIRLTKGRDHTCTVWTDETNYSWHWGSSGHTLVSNDMTKKGRMIEDTITRDFGISLN